MSFSDSRHDRQKISLPANRDSRKKLLLATGHDDQKKLFTVKLLSPSRFVSYQNFMVNPSRNVRGSAAWDMKSFTPSAGSPGSLVA